METNEDDFHSRATRLALALLFIYCTATPILAVTPANCPNCDTLDELVDFVKDSMPSEDSGLYSEPDAQALSDWRQTIGQIMSGQCQSLVLPTSLLNHYTAIEFNDTTDGRDYCVLYEIGDSDLDGTVDLGWGTFIFNSANDAKPLAIDVPSPCINNPNYSHCGTGQDISAQKWIVL